jgi:hypothetical protein
MWFEHPRHTNRCVNFISQNQGVIVGPTKVPGSVSRVGVRIPSSGGVPNTGLSSSSRMDDSMRSCMNTFGGGCSWLDPLQGFIRSMTYQICHKLLKSHHYQYQWHKSISSCISLARSPRMDQRAAKRPGLPSERAPISRSPIRPVKRESDPISLEPNPNLSS